MAARDGSAAVADSCCCVRIRGPDAERVVAGRRAFYLTSGGSTACSGSGVLLPLHTAAGATANSQCLCLTSATLLSPWLVGEGLLPAARVEVLRRGCWHPAALARLVPVPAAAAQLAALLRCATAEWAMSDPPEDGADAVAAAAAATTLAVLTMQLSAEEPPPPACSWDAAQLAVGQAVRAWGAPFGLLAPAVFGVYCVSGTVAGAPSSSAGGVLLLLDARWLPGLEGAPLQALTAAGSGSGLAALAGLLLPALTHLRTGLQLPLALTAAAVADAMGTSGRVDGTFSLCPPGAAPVPSLSSALEAVVPLRTGSGAWASATVVSNARGRLLLLTSAHVLTGQRDFGPGRSEAAAAAAAAAAAPCGAWPSVELLLPCGPRPASVLLVSLGAWDVALLEAKGAVTSGSSHGGRLRPFPRPAADACPSAGDPVACIGYGLAGPAVRPPLVSSGTVTRVLLAPWVAQQPPRPVMLLTSAQVHAGSSGGALVHPADGRLLGLVSSNVRRAGAAAPIGHLNFAIPVACLEPVWAYAAGELSMPMLARALHPCDPAVARLWALESELPPVASSKL